MRALRVNVNPSNLLSRQVAEEFWQSSESGLKAWDLITPNRASNKTGEFVILLPNEDYLVITREVFVVRVQEGQKDGWSPFCLLWALCLSAVRLQWERIAIMQTNREDAGDRYREILLPSPPNKNWADTVSGPFWNLLTIISQSMEDFRRNVDDSSFKFIASVSSQ